MGSSSSTESGHESAKVPPAPYRAPPPKDLVLVPPLFERDFRGRSRMTGSSYDWMFCKPGLKWLFNDYMRQKDTFGIWRLRPSDDPRLTVHARLSVLNKELKTGSNGRMALRFQPVVEEPLTFLDIKAGTRGASAVARACYFNAEQGYGAFASVPLASRQLSGSVPDPSLGLRYSSPTASFGVIGMPLSQNISKAWAVGKWGPLCGGVQICPNLVPANGNYLTVGDLLEAAPRCTSYALSYSPDGATAGRNRFTTALEVKEARELTVSLLYHVAANRQCKNPLEESKVVAITNYLDLGLQITSSLVETGSAADGARGQQDSNLRLAASWQVNKNWLMKARVGSDAAAFALALKAWWQPSVTFGISAVYDYALRAPRIGFTFNMENYGNIRYERSEPSIRTGKALVQRHVALPADIANQTGKGLLVLEKDLNNKELLGQTQAPSAQYL